MYKSRTKNSKKCRYCDNAIDLENGTWLCSERTIIDTDLEDEFLEEINPNGTCELWRLKEG